MIEVTKNEILELKEGTQYVIYNPFSGLLSIVTAGKKDIAHNKYCVPNLKFYMKEKENETSN